MGQRILAIRNPVSGRGSGARLRSTVEDALRAALSEGTHLELATTERPGHAEELARETRGFDRVIAVGGDGTIGDVVNGLLGTQIPLGIIPLGTGNDVARHLGLYGDLARAAQIAVNGTPRPIDVGEQGNGRAFLNACGCGFDAVVAERVNQGYRMLKGTAAYVAAVVQALRTYEATPLRLTLDGHVIEREAMLCAVANASSYGGGMKIAPRASMEDGLLDVVLVAKTGTLEFLRAFPRVFKGTHLTHPKVEMWQVREVRLEPLGAPPLVLADGELVGHLPAEFRVKPSSLPVCW